MRPFRVSFLHVLTLTLSLAATISLAQAPSRPTLQTVERIDLERYMGLWYEVALIPNRFQSMCTADTTATYALKPNGRVSVTNRCRLRDNGFATAQGEARRSEPQSTTRLQVRFAPAWLGWMDAVWGDYWVIGIDADYRWALVGEPAREFLWLLSRTPQLDAASREAAMAIAQNQGYNLDRIKNSPQSASN